MDSPMVEFTAALFASDLDKLSALLDKGFDVNQRSPRSSDTPFIAAARLGTDAFVRKMIEHGADLKVRDSSNGQTALHVVCLEGKAKRVRLLLEAGANPNVKDDFGQSPLSVALIHDEKKYIAVVKELLQRGADSDEDKYEGNLMLAAKNSRPECVAALIDAGAKVNRVYPGGTALISAIMHNRDLSIRLLIDKGADPHLAVPANCPNDRIAGKNAFQMAELLGNKKATSLLQRNFGS
jgi:ankyrin repeat protein